MSKVSEALDKFENAVRQHCFVEHDHISYNIEEDRDEALIPHINEVARTRKELLRVIAGHR